MVRKLRLEYPGAIYNVINRGSYRSWKFESKGAKNSFRKAIFETCERVGWRLHGWAIKGNDYQFAVETLESDLSEGMRWLQGVFAKGFNHLCRERRALFQDRFKAIVVLDFEQFGWLCHCINLSLIRAKVCKVLEFKALEYSSYWLLRKKRLRPNFLSFEVCLEGAGGLADGSYGSKNYEQYLEWLSEDGPRMKSMKFDRIRKDWATGSAGFKIGLLDDEKRISASTALGDSDAKAARELAWEKSFLECLRIVGRMHDDSDLGRKAENWKVAVAGYLKLKRLCRNGWLADRLGMGSESEVSRYISHMQSGERREAKDLFDRIITKIKC